MRRISQCPPTSENKYQTPSLLVERKSGVSRLVQLMLTKQLGKLGFNSSNLLRVLLKICVEFTELDSFDLLYFLLHLVVSENPAPPPEDFSRTYELAGHDVEAEAANDIGISFDWPIMDMVGSPNFTFAIEFIICQCLGSHFCAVM